MSNQLILENITQEHFLNIQNKIGSSLGLNLKGNSGSGSEYGIEVAWNYDPTTLKVILTNTKKPWFVSEDLVMSKLKEACV